MTHVGRCGQLFAFTLVYRSLVVQPLAMYIRTSPWCAQTIFLTVFHEADLLQPIPTSLSSPVADLLLCICVRIVSTSALSSPLCCLVFILFLWNFCCVFPVHFQYSAVAAHLKEFTEVCCLYSPCFSSVEKTGEHTRDEHIGHCYSAIPNLRVQSNLNDWNKLFSKDSREYDDALMSEMQKF